MLNQTLGSKRLWTFIRTRLWIERKCHNKLLCKCWDKSTRAHIMGESLPMRHVPCEAVKDRTILSFGWQLTQVHHVSCSLCNDNFTLWAFSLLPCLQNSCELTNITTDLWKIMWWLSMTYPQFQWKKSKLLCEVFIFWCNEGNALWCPWKWTPLYMFFFSSFPPNEVFPLTAFLKITALDFL